MTLPAPIPPSLRTRLIFLFRRVIKPVSLERRAEVQIQLRESSHPGFDFFLLVLLSCVIATLGLLTNSGAVIIGAMLVAPLMSPIIGLGLASITGDARLFRDAGFALIQGALAAIFISIVLTLFNRLLPFILLQDLPTEIISRTRPSPIDLTIALAGGMAAAYALAQPQLSAALPGVAIATALMPPLCTVGIGIALGRWDVAGGAALLFVTNAVTIAFAGILIFFVLGFSPKHEANRFLPRALVISAVLTLLLLFPLTLLGVRFFTQASENIIVNQVVASEVTRHGGQLASLQTNQNDSTLQMNITLRTSSPLSYADVIQLQRDIALRLQKPVSIVVNQVFVARLDPLIPPTYTLTPTPVTLTPTPTASITPTPTPTTTSTPSPTATPALARVVNTGGYKLDLLQSPGGPSIGTLRPRDSVSVLYGEQIFQGLVWLQVRDSEGRIGWVPQIYLAVVTFTPLPATPTAP
jgi:uncharacterized hydrophobic protein (TIGR00271 family)